MLRACNSGAREAALDFGLYLPCHWPDRSRPWAEMYPAMVEQARRAEALGFASLSIPEHHFMNYLTHPSALLSAVKVASVTERIPIVTSVLVLPFCDVRQLAGYIAQTDHLTDGRLQIGVGRGAFRYEFDRLDKKIEESRDIFDESLDLLEALLTQENVSWSSPNYRFEALTVTPRPLQQPRPPIWIAALHPDAIAACVKRGYNIQTTPLRDPFEAARQQAAGFYRGVAAAGDAGQARRLSLLRNCHVAIDRDDARQAIALAYEKHRLFSNVRRTEGTIRDGFIEPMTVPETLEDIAASVIIDTAEGVIEKLRAYEGLGIHELILDMDFGQGQAAVLASMTRFHRDVMPAFAGRPTVVPDFAALAPASDTAGTPNRDMPFGGGVGSLPGSP